MGRNMQRNWTILMKTKKDQPLLHWGCIGSVLFLFLSHCFSLLNFVSCHHYYHHHYHHHHHHAHCLHTSHAHVLMLDCVVWWEGRDEGKGTKRWTYGCCHGLRVSERESVMVASEDCLSSTHHSKINQQTDNLRDSVTDAQRSWSTISQSRIHAWR